MENFNKKQYELFFGGSVSKYFNGHTDLYLGDKDFVFADKGSDLDPGVHITAEIKKVGVTGFTGKKLTLNQAREYSATVGIIDNIGRTMLSYFFEYHSEVKNPYVIVTPFKPSQGNKRNASDYLNLNLSRMLYVDKDDQFCRWLSGDRYAGVKPKNPLQTIENK